MKCDKCGISASAGISRSAFPAQNPAPDGVKRLARYPQLYSRVGFVHAYHTLSAEEPRNVLMGHASDLVERLPVDALSDAEAMAAILRITD